MSPMPQKTYDPLLRKAMGEIVQIMKKYDCAGYVALGSLTHFEFRLMPEASWSMLSTEISPDCSYSLRVKIKGKLDKARQQMADASIGFLYNLRDHLGIQVLGLFRLSDYLDTKAKIDHKPGDPRQNDDREIEDRA